MITEELEQASLELAEATKLMMEKQHKFYQLLAKWRSGKYE